MQETMLSFELPELKTELLLAMYPRGFFPWYNEGEPIVCVSPPVRCVLYPSKIHIAARTKRYMRQMQYASRINSDFAGVVRHCATVARKEQGTWITAALYKVFLSLFEMGYAYSFEIYQQDTLCGGLYGLRINNIFYGESMFSLNKHASIVALANLCSFAQTHHINVIDCQIPSSHLLRHGAEVVSRNEFITLVNCL